MFVLTALLFVLVSMRLGVSASPYIVTTYVMLSIYTPTKEGYTHLYTELIGIFPDSTVPAITTITTSMPPDLHEGPTVLAIVKSTGSRLPYIWEFERTAVKTLQTYTIYVVPLTYSRVASCTGQDWDFTTTGSIRIPQQVSMTPFTASTTTQTRSALAYYSETTAVMVLAQLNPTDVDPGDFSDMSNNNRPWPATRCYSPTTYCSQDTRRVAVPTCVTQIPAYSNENLDMGNGSYWYQRDEAADKRLVDHKRVRLILVCVLVPVIWIIFWFLLGLYENWLSFKGLMLGQHRPRGFPIAWCCVCVLALFCIGPTYKAKSLEEQLLLRERYRVMRGEDRWRAWWKWGFRWRYPGFLGEEPEVAREALVRRLRGLR